MGTSPDELITDLVQALLDEERARREVRAAMRRQAELLRALRDVGLPATLVAHRLASARGTALPVPDRLRMAQRLRKRALRETSRPRIRVGARGLPVVATSPCDRAPMPIHQENDMASKLIKRVITEEFVGQEGPDLDEQEVDEMEESENQDEDADEPKRSRRRQ